MSDLQEQEKPKKKRGRPKNENYLQWVEARDFVRSELIPSRGKYFEWWERNKPKAIPRFPYRVYKEWTSWNDFLGTDNKFNEKAGRSWRPLEEATIFVHKLKLDTQARWMDWCKENKAQLPDDIPARPDLVYDKWRSWNHWLGNKVVEAVQAQQQAQSNAVYFIIHERGVPENVFTFGIEQGGPTGLKDRWERERFDVCKLFWYDPSKANVIKQIVGAFSRPYLANEKQRIAPNVWEIVYYLEIHLQTIRNVKLATPQSPSPVIPEDTWEYEWKI